jgi:Fic-DOC domain mobile mystery protein B
MGLNLEYTEGQTPIDIEERNGLLIKTISNRKELNEHEQLNIEEAIEWTLKRKFKKIDILSEKFLRDLHKKMFERVWNWAGNFRDSDKNIGVDKFQIPVKIKQLLDDCNYWIENNIFLADEIAIRFKHKLVSIHPFPNGNGRHSRLIADVIISKIFHKPVFGWGNKSSLSDIELRAFYLKSLQEADNGNYENLLLFSRS